MKAKKQISNLWNSGSTYDGRYENLFEHDANGNITTQIRKDAVGNAIDELTYQYAKENGKLHHNRLYHINDNISSSAFDDDIDDMGTFDDTDLTAMMFNNNYVYDAIGNLIKDEQEETDSMIWRPDGKLEKIVRSSSSGKLNLKFDYDVSGNRIAKHVIDKVVVF